MRSLIILIALFSLGFGGSSFDGEGFGHSNNPNLMFASAEAWNITTAIIADWRMNDNAANKTVVDSSSNAHNGALIVANTSVRSVAGNIAGGTALDMNDADHIKVGDHADFTFGDGATDSPFSFATWVNITADTVKQNLVCKRNDSLADPNIEYEIFVNADETITVRLYKDSTTYPRIGRVTTASYTGWRFVVVNYTGSGAASGITIHVDGAGDDSTTDDNSGTYTAMQDTAAELVIGDFLDSGNDTWNYPKHEFDRTILLNRVLTDEEIDFLYNSGNGTEANSG